MRRVALPSSSCLSKWNARLSFGMLNLTKGRLLSVVCALFVAAPTVFAQSSIKLSEILASNLTFVNQGAITDWVELVNESGADVDLTGVSFSDDEFNPTKWS